MSDRTNRSHEAPGMELPGGRVRLEPMRVDHAEGLFHAVRDPSIWWLTPTLAPQVVADARAYIDAALALAAAGTDIPYVVIDRFTGRVCGTTRYCDISRSNRSVEIGWTMYATSHQRTSTNTECKMLLLAHAFEVWPFPGGAGCHRVQLKCDARNLRSQQAILRIGAKFEGCLRKHRVLGDGFVRDSMFYSIIREEWPEVKARLQNLLRHSPTPDLQA